MTLDFDALSREQLSRPTSRKWSLHPGSIGAWVAEMDFGTAPVVQRAIEAGVRDQLFGYLTPALARDAAEATSDWCAAEYGWRPDPRRVHAVTDVLSALEIAVRQFSRPESAIIVPTPAYMPFLTLPRTLGRRLLQVPGEVVDGRWVLDLERLDEAFASGGGVLVLCNPHNPTGRVFDRAELERIADVVERHGGLVFADEIHAPIVFEGAHVPYASLSAATAAHTITATSASKAWNVPGLKAAQLILSSEAHEQRFQADGMGHLAEPSTLGVVAATAAYRHGRDWLVDVRAYLDRNRLLLADLLADALPEVGFAPPEGTYLGWLDCAALALPEAPERWFRERAGVALTAGALCGRGFEQHVRIVFATPAPILAEIVHALASSVAERRVLV
ncbi:MalY/PatB family protein [Amnibacterium kyonggiense]|uniref:cysteine-S-conjugate beta-lyase n=1 Tax=Amnibacterium kyonggiense TaxID=595671 RepID=A0A4R7FR20_9MICO|nr:aminotransferase class I/II-fold pyridoxal phosphate-dependent enzyme [Amnibacterium kyonggiense]TDS80247.1 cystathionine beta-lyase [Amnibacterium kyonggiense]